MILKNLNIHNPNTIKRKANRLCFLLLLCLMFTGNTPFAAEHSEATDMTGTLQSHFSGVDDLDELISINFDQVDIRIMIKTIGDITGINFVVDDTITGTVTVMLPTKIRLGDICEVLEAVLEVKGYAAVSAGNLVKIIPKSKAIRHNLHVRFGADPSQIPQNESPVTQIIPLKYADVAEVSNIIKPILATTSYMAIYPKTNSILITDISSNIHHVAKIIETLDVKGSGEKVSVISLKSASAQVLSEQITLIMQKSEPTSSRNIRSRTSSQIKDGLRVLPDVRTNSLIVVANEQDTEAIRALALQLDIDRPDVANNVHVVYLKNAPAIETADSLNAALSNMSVIGRSSADQNINVTADEGTNALIITASKQDFEIVAKIIEKLDIVREQVLVEMLILEISEESLTEIGIDWATLDKAVSDSVRFFASTNFGPRVDFASGNVDGLAVGAFKKNGSTTNIGSILTALERNSGLNILSTPHIVTSNHNTAKIIVGENIPYVVESRITETDVDTPTVIDNFEYKDVGISLEITPHISQDGLVRLEIESEFTKLIQGVTGSSVNTPTTAKRQAKTVVSMNDGSTIVIGGLIRDDTIKVVDKIPLLGDLPLIGGLFRFTTNQTQKTNLLIFITPYIMTNQQDMDRITERKKGEMSPEIERLMKNSQNNNN